MLTRPRRSRTGLVTLLIGTIILSGCQSNECIEFDPHASYPPFVQQIEYPSPDCERDSATEFVDLQAPPTVRNPSGTEKWPMTLQEAIETALGNSRVIRDIGGRVVTTPAATTTIYDPAIQEADPRFGLEAALSAFDAQLTGQLFAQQTDQRFNNTFIGSSGTLRNLGDFLLSVNKTGATGTQYSLQNVTDYSRIHGFVPSTPGRPNPNSFASVWNTILQAEVRHPLFQGSGVEFNRIAGPNSTPGNYNGVLIARINSDISIADFETAVRDLIRDTEQTYWELYFAYRDFDAKSIGRQLALESWELEKRRVDAGLTRADQEAFAREQYYAAQVAVENALSGTALGGGIYAVERQLRSLLGLPTTDGQVIVPVDSPLVVDVQFDWHESLAYSLTRRVELRRQQWTVKRRELELKAAHNFEKMRVDFIGQYRWRGFGDALFGSSHRAVNGGAFDTLFDGDLQDWRFGVEVSTPIGNRVGHAAVRHAELQVTREHAIYDEMERQITQELRAAYTELDRAYAVSRSNYNRRVATFIRLEAERQRNREGTADLDLVLDAQRQAVTAESDYFRSIVDYNLALMNIQFSRGALLDRHGIDLTEGAWSEEAHRSADKLARRFWEKMDYCVTCPADVSLGAYPQQTDSERFPPVDGDDNLLPNPGLPDVPAVPEVMIEPISWPSS